MSEDIKRKVIEALHESRRQSEKTKDKPKPSRKSKPSTIKQTAIGNGIIQAGGDINGNFNITIKEEKKKVNRVIPFPEGAIGNNAILVETITGLFNKLGERRENRFGKSAYPTMYNTFKKDFGIPKNQKYLIYKNWSEARAKEIIDYLQQKLDNTTEGRKKIASIKKGHTRPYLLKQTSELHECLGWSEYVYRGRLHHLFGVISRRDLNVSQLKSYVEYLEDEYGKKY